MVTKHLKPEWLHLAVEKQRNQHAVFATFEPKTLRDLKEQLKKKEVIGFALDQYAGPPVSVRVPFLGRPVGTSTAAATIAKRFGATILPVFQYREGRGKMVIEYLPPFEWVKDENSRIEIAKNTALLTEIIEDKVREFPDHWLWTHRRFKGDLSPLRDGEWREGRSRR